MPSLEEISASFPDDQNVQGIEQQLIETAKTVAFDSRERVALDLAKIIYSCQDKEEHYWLNLYRKCRQTVFDNLPPDPED